MEKRALVLSGGSIKGCFQAGAVAGVLASGFKPDAIYGTSVGSLNGGFLADRSGRQGGPADWPRIGIELKGFWIDSITGFRAIGRSRSIVELGWKLLTRSFNGLLSMSKLHRLVRREIKAANIKLSSADFSACAVNIKSGDAIHAGKDHPDIVEFIIASTAIPIMMPIVDVGGDPYWDGGVRDVAPMKEALHEGATQIVCIACDTARTPPASEYRFRGKLLKQVERLMDMVVNETLANDIETVKDVNTYLEDCPGPAGLLARRHKVDLIEIRPIETLQIDLTKFDTDDIARLIDLGQQAAEKAMSDR